MSTAVESVTEEGPSTAKDVTKPVSALDLIKHGAEMAAGAGARPAAYQPRLRTDSITRAPMAFDSQNLSKLEGYEAHGAPLGVAVSAMDAR